MATRNFLARKFTNETAQEFDRYSDGNAHQLKKVAEDKGCTCQPYVDWFTYKRWSAQGFQVLKGQHGTKLTQFVPFEDEKADGSVEKKVSFKTTTVFCRCQVATKEEAAKTFETRSAVTEEQFSAIEI